jgi:hypothetical protein
MDFKAKININAPPGAGKTFGAIRLATGLTGDATKVCVLDSESGRAALAKAKGLGNYRIVQMNDISPNSYITELTNAVKNGAQAIVIDSFTHEWEWILDIQQKLGGKFQDWNTAKNYHKSLKTTIIRCPVHLITTCRCKLDRTIEINASGKSTVVTHGLKSVTEDGWDYEVNINFYVDKNHLATCDKDDSNLFMQLDDNLLPLPVTPFIITEETGKRIATWCNEVTKQLSENTI